MREQYLKEFEKLNEFQKKAVTSRDKYVILNAVVGSGKTTVLIHKVLYSLIIDDIPLKDMVVLTFTNKAAEEIRERIASFDEGLIEDMKYFGTFHSVARTILKEHTGLRSLGYDEDFKLIDREESISILEDIAEKNKLKIKYRSKLFKRLEDFKIGKTLYGIMKSQDDISELFALYNEEKKNRNIMDFDDLIENAIKILDEPLNPRMIIIDEFQDTDEKQLMLIRKLEGSRTSIYVIGDPNQIIYSWRTGSTDIFKSFKEIYNSKEISLPINYRSTKTIIEAAKSLLGQGSMEGVMEYGSPIVIKRHIDAFNEGMHIARRIKEMVNKGIPLNDIAVLYRRQAQCDIIQEVLKNMDIPTRLVFKKNLPFENEKGEDNKEGVTLLTMHASKGLEFSHVFIIGANMGNIPISTRMQEENEEIRLFFVAITRAKKYIEISYLSKPALPGTSQFASPYIWMIPKELISIEDNESSSTLSNLMEMLREEREKKRREMDKKRVEHEKYGEGIVIYEDDSIMRVDFNGYGEKEFSKMFCPLKIIY